jgi:hypothetical protein
MDLLTHRHSLTPPSNYRHNYQTFTMATKATKRLPTSKGGLGRSDSTISGYNTATEYLNSFLTQENKYPPLALLREEHVKGNHLSSLIEDLARWFAATRFWTK